MILSIGVKFDGNYLINDPRFYSTRTYYLQISLYNADWKTLLGFNYKIIIIRCVLTIITV